MKKEKLAELAFKGNRQSRAVGSVNTQWVISYICKKLNKLLTEIIMILWQQEALLLS